MSRSLTIAALLSCTAVGFVLGNWAETQPLSAVPLRVSANITPVSSPLPQDPQPTGFSPVKARSRDFYCPNSEALAPNEMRVIACGTGMPTARPSQAAACFL